MITLLAQATATLPDPTHYASIGWLMVCIAGVFGAINQILKFFDRFKPNPPLYKEYASKFEHDGLRVEFTEFRNEVRDAFTNSARASSASREKIYVALKEQAKQLVENTTMTALTSQRLEKLDTKIDRILEREAAQ